MRGGLSPSGTRLAPTEATRRPVACCSERLEQLQNRGRSKKALFGRSTASAKKSFEVKKDTFLQCEQWIDLMQIFDLVINLIFGTCRKTVGIVPAGRDAGIVAAADIAGKRVSDDQDL